MKERVFAEIENNNYKNVKATLKEMFVQDIADLLEEIEDPAILLKVFKLLTKDVGAEVFSYVNPDCQEALINVLTDKELVYIVEELSIDDAVDLVDEMPANIVERILKISTKDTRSEINKLLKYEDDSAGSIMTTEFLAIKENLTAEQAINKIRKIGDNVETINVIYVTDKSKILKGVLSIRDILLAEPDELIGDIMSDNIIFATTNTDQETIAQDFKQYDIISMPIVDNEKRMVGIVTIDDIVRVIEDENTEDISKMAAVTPNDKPYLKTSVWKLFLQRVPWIMLLMISSSITSLIITKNESILNASAFGIILTACIPMIMGTGGNTGGQVSVTIIRGIALDEIRFKDIFKVIWKEIRVAVILGLSVSIVCFAKLLYLDGIINEPNGILVASVICLAMFVTICIAKVVGCILPLLAKKLHLDPAVMASPFITTIIDAVSLIILCNLSLQLLPA